MCSKKEQVLSLRVDPFHKGDKIILTELYPFPLTGYFLIKLKFVEARAQLTLKLVLLIKCKGLQMGTS